MFSQVSHLPTHDYAMPSGHRGGPRSFAPATGRGRRKAVAVRFPLLEALTERRRIRPDR
jgi:hypothetical protein